MCRKKKFLHLKKVFTNNLVETQRKLSSVVRMAMRSTNWINSMGALRLPLSFSVTKA